MWGREGLGGQEKGDRRAWSRWGVRLHTRGLGLGLKGHPRNSIRQDKTCAARPVRGTAQQVEVVLGGPVQHLH